MHKCLSARFTIFAGNTSIMRTSLILFMGLLLFSSCQERNEMDLLIHNAKIYTVDEGFSIVEAIAIDGGRIVDTGDSRSLQDKYSYKESRDMQGAVIYPGLIDAHCHFYGYGLGRETRADLNGTQSFEEIIDTLIQYHKEHPANWLEGRGWDQNDWPVKKFPDRVELDRHFPDIPVLLTRIDGHAMLVNGKALEKAGITRETQVEGGEVLQKDGRLTGVLIDNAMQLMDGIIPEPDTALMRRALIHAEEDCFSYGLTMVADAGLRKNEIEVIRELHASNDLHMRLYTMLTPTEETLGAYLSKGPESSEKLIISSIKLYADGALGSRGALLLEPYSDSPTQKGLVLDGPDTLREICKMAYANDFQVNVHCIGDGAVRMVLDVFEEFLEPGNDRRWRIEHAQTVHPDDVPRFGELGVVPSIQATHATSDMYWADERLGDRIVTAYAYKDLLNACGWIPNGTDFPIEQINPVHTFFASVFRKDLDFWPEDGFQMENALSREEALRSMTIWAAKSCFAEDFTGSLEKGKVADFVVMSDDLMTADEKDVPGIRVRETWLDGKRVY